MISKLRSLDDIKGLFVAHGEKLVVGGIGVLVVLLIWAAIGQPRIESSHHPDALGKLASAAQANINSTSAKAKLNEDALERIPYQEKLKVVPLELDDYLSTKRLNPRIWAAKTKRDDPTLLPVVALEVHTGFSAILINHEPVDRAARRDRPGPIQNRIGAALNGPFPGLAPGQPGPDGPQRQPSNAEGRRWAVIVGLVPYRKQVAEFERVFLGAEGYDRENDQPNYLGYRVERREVVDGKRSKWQPIATFRKQKVAEITKGWARREQEIVERKFVKPNLTHPLPPRVPEDWDEQVTHTKVPLIDDEDDLDPRAIREQQQPADGFGGGNDDDVRRRGKRRIDAARRMDERLGLQSQPSKTAKFYLLRFFDFKVKPGRTYQYRIQLALTDPNHGVEAKFLAAEVLKRDRKLTWVIGPPSKPSSFVVIPYEATVLAGPAKILNAEPRIKVLLRQLDMKTGDTAQAEHELYRGGVGNFSGMVKSVAAKDGEFREEIESELNTDVLLLDIHGGEKISSIDRGLTQPSELLLLDAAGNFFVRDELEDVPELRRHAALGAKSYQRQPGLGVGPLGQPPRNPKQGRPRDRLKDRVKNPGRRN